MRNDRDFFIRNPHEDMLSFLRLTDGDPMMNLVKKIHPACSQSDRPHDTALEMALMPAGRPQGRYEISIHTPLARLTMIKEKSVHAAHPVIVKVLHNGHSQLKCQFVDSWRHGRKDIMDEPEVVARDRLIIPKLSDDAPV